MTKEMCYDIIKNVLNEFGFSIREYECWFGTRHAIDDPMGVVLVSIDEDEHAYDNGFTRITRFVKVKACAKSCGSYIQPDEMMKVATRMAQTAAMLKVFDEMELSYTEDISFKEEAK